MITAMATPFYANGEINYEKAAELAAFLVNNGTDGIVVCGTTGESPTLAEEEKKELFSVIAATVRGKAKVLAGTGSNNTVQAIRLTKIAENCGVDGIMLVVPYYNKPPQEGLFRHFSAIAAQTTLPVMVYNVPGRTVVNMTAETTLRLAQISNIVAVKEASGDLEQIARIRAGAPDNFAVYSGDDSMTLPVLAVGGIGVVSVVSHIAGREIKEMITAFKSGDTETAAKSHLKLLPLFKAMFITTSPTPLKGAMNMLGHNLGPVRLPLVGLTENQHKEIAEVLTGLGYL
ncbi:MAG: 4-hydroxy-tetrahydrodipicolinate synthase [Dethiobacter sp.]|nr:4-hydroxy-tetrahydrodipicolinate synthase [Dethiobacter sp.]MBS3900679.1 4-hydroxy-tetrahydrodipicolinate synthase [Dethiobacter sp.]MBS3989273.1 4-hydroxy-tetrahydrodipicolinate synthase [Dethiobacter sp.]MBS3989599.1 4-hydroxy-tetrahydrodipicolinate synthase [Dethiobacter sp.]